MTSKIVVNNIESDSGINTVTIIGDVSVGSSITATDITATHHGSGADLTNLPAANLTGTLPAIDGSNLTGVGASFGNSSVNTSGIITASNFVSTSQGALSHRNIIINGAMKINHHSDSNAGVNNTFAVDRFEFRRESTAANFTSNEFVLIQYKIEAQDLQHLGYGTSAAKPLVLSFYVRSNLTGTYGISCIQKDNSNKIYARTYTINSADTWERKTISIPADTSGVINDDNGEGFQINFGLVLGSSYKGGAVSTAWETYANDKFASQHGVNFASSTSNEWYLTGVQLEVGTVVTPFEHRKYGDDLLLCQRYFRVIKDGNEDNGGYIGYMSYNYDVNSVVTQINFIPEMRATPTIASTSGTNYYRFYRNSGYSDINAMNAINGMGRKGGAFNNSDSGNGTAGQSGGIVLNNSSAKIAFDAEL